jgi:steroid delta-isomerase-like uncharacterized protein
MVAALNAHDVRKIEAMLSRDYEGLDVNQAQPQRGRRDALTLFERYLEAFPDLLLVEHELIVEGDRVALLWRAPGTHRGSIMHIPPTGKEVEVRGSTMLYLAGNQIRRAVSVWDVAAMLRGMGLLPELT